MLLKNKKTGEIGELQITEKHCAVVVGNGTANCNVKLYCTLDKLNEEWEDAPEEPKEYWRIDCDGTISHGRDDFDAPFDNACKEIGNYFDTREEAVKAVEKLKAWKRLKDKGFRFTAWYGGSKSISYEITSLENETYIPRQICDDLDLLFGGVE